MEPNEYQIGGDHYKKEYEHWDFVCDTNMPYLLGCATKYVARYKDKNGIEDLRKAIHYLSKAEERNIHMPRNKWYEIEIFPTTENLILDYTMKFILKSNLDRIQGDIVIVIVRGSYDIARLKLKELIEEIECGPGPHYIKG